MRYARSPILFGRDQHRTRQCSLLAAVVFLVSTVVYSAVLFGVILSTSPLVFLPVVIAVGGAVGHAYLNDGLLGSLLVTVALGLGVELPWRIGFFFPRLKMEHPGWLVTSTYSCFLCRWGL
jgi:hypothetical protein